MEQQFLPAKLEKVIIKSPANRLAANEEAVGLYKQIEGMKQQLNAATNTDIDKEEFIDAIATLRSYHINESVTSKTKFPLIYGIISIYTTFILEEPIHPVGTPFPGSLYVEEKDGKFYCPVKDANLESPNAVCKMCIAEQLEF